MISEDLQERGKPGARALARLAEVNCGILVVLMVAVFARFLMGSSTADFVRAFGFSLGLHVFIGQRAAWPPVRRGAERLARLGRMAGQLLLRHPLAVAALFFAGFFFCYGIAAFGIRPGYGADTSFFVEALFNAFHPSGLFYRSLDGEGSALAIHFSPYLFALIPLAWFRETPVLLYCVAFFAVSAAFFLIIRTVCEEKLSDSWKVALILVTIGNPFWKGLVGFEFHELALAPLFSVLLYRAWRRKSMVWALLWIVCLLGIKETTAFAGVSCGVFLAIGDRSPFGRRLAASMVALSVGAMVLYFGFVLPHVTGGVRSTRFIGLYSNLGSTQLEVALAPILKPAAWAGNIFSMGNLRYLALMFVPALFFLPGGWTRLLFAASSMYFVLLIPDAQYKNPSNQYAGELMIPLFLVNLAGARWLLHRYGDASWVTRLALAWSLAFAFFYYPKSPVRETRMFFEKAGEGFDSRGFVSYLRDLDPREPVLVDCDEVLPFIAKRDNFYLLGHHDRFPKPGVIVIRKADSFDPRLLAGYDVVHTYGDFKVLKPAARAL